MGSTERAQSSRAAYHELLMNLVCILTGVTASGRSVKMHRFRCSLKFIKAWLRVGVVCDRRGWPSQCVAMVTHPSSPMWKLIHARGCVCESWWRGCLSWWHTHWKLIPLLPITNYRQWVACSMHVCIFSLLQPAFLACMAGRKTMRQQ